MSDPKLLADQSGLANLISPEMQSELDSISRDCLNAVIDFSNRFSSTMMWQDAFLLKLLGDYSGLDTRLLDFWSASSIFGSINPMWKIMISTMPFNHIRANSPNQELYLYYLINLMKGRFKYSLREEDEYYIVTSTQLFKICLA